MLLPLISILLLVNSAAAAPLAIERAAAATSRPQLMLAISLVESSWNINARGKAGEVGALQLHPKYHVVPKTVNEQFKYADKYLRYLERRCGKQLFLACYNAGPRKVMLDKKLGTRYTKRVMEAYSAIAKNAQNRRTPTRNQSKICYTADN